MKRALITGITGQDGSYLAELLLEKGYEVYGLIRRKSVITFGNIEHRKNEIKFIYADMTDLVSLVNAMRISQADEVYNLAAQSFVGTSWEQPGATADIDGIGALNMLEAIRTVKPEARFYQASTSEMFGLVQAIPQNEDTPFYPYTQDEKLLFIPSSYPFLSFIGGEWNTLFQQSATTTLILPSYYPCQRKERLAKGNRRKGKYEQQTI